MSKIDEIILFFANLKRDCAKCPIKTECNECDLEINCDEMAQRELKKLSEVKNG